MKLCLCFVIFRLEQPLLPLAPAAIKATKPLKKGNNFMVLYLMIDKVLYFGLPINCFGIYLLHACFCVLFELN